MNSINCPMEMHFKSFQEDWTDPKSNDMPLTISIESTTCRTFK